MELIAIIAFGCVICILAMKAKSRTEILAHEYDHLRYLAKRMTSNIGFMTELKKIQSQSVVSRKDYEKILEIYNECSSKSKKEFYSLELRNPFNEA